MLLSEGQLAIDLIVYRLDIVPQEESYFQHGRRDAKL
uniref:Uncharacterized protein n=1 Tax=Anguilla anguilla TaxID=7936 RepID=A0A0E9TRJ2_ANGAN